MATSRKTLEWLDSERLVREFGVRDKKGRWCGAQVSFSVVEYFEDVATEHGYRNREPGRFIAARPQALRNGHPYGATNAPHEFATLDEAKAWAETYFVAAKKRALKGNEGRA